MIDGMKVENTTLAGSVRRVLIAMAYAVMFSVVGIARAESGAGTAPESPQAEAVYDATQPGADDPRAKAGFEAYKAGDFKRAYGIWLPLAEAGNPEAQFRIGRLYDLGELFPANGNAAAKWYERARQGNHVSATFNLGLMCVLGSHGSRQLDRGISLLLEVVEKRGPVAQRMLGVAYAFKGAATSDYVEAYKWFYIALENGDEMAAIGIEKLGTVASLKQRYLGKNKMREWLETHSR